MHFCRHSLVAEPISQECSESKSSTWCATNFRLVTLPSNRTLRRWRLSERGFNVSGEQSLEILQRSNQKWKSVPFYDETLFVWCHKLKQRLSHQQISYHDLSGSLFFPPPGNEIEPIRIKVNAIRNQWELELIIRKQPQAREKADDWVAFSCLFVLLLIS